MPTPIKHPAETRRSIRLSFRAVTRSPHSTYSRTQAMAYAIRMSCSTFTAWSISSQTSRPIRPKRKCATRGPSFLSTLQAMSKQQHCFVCFFFFALNSYSFLSRTRPDSSRSCDANNIQTVTFGNAKSSPESTSAASAVLVSSGNGLDAEMERMHEFWSTVYGSSYIAYH